MKNNALADDLKTATNNHILLNRSLEKLANGIRNKIVANTKADKIYVSGLEIEHQQSDGFVITDSDARTLSLAGIIHIIDKDGKITIEKMHEFSI